MKGRTKPNRRRGPLQHRWEILVGELCHFDASGASRMVDVGDKPVSRRLARASGCVRMAAETLALVRDKRAAKGDVLEVARLAGIMAAKRTSDLIPLCHPLPIDAVSIDFTFVDAQTLRIEATVQVEAKTGIEMEALTAVSVAALHGLRHVQGRGPRHVDRADSARRKIRRPQRALETRRDVTCKRPVGPSSARSALCLAANLGANLRAAPSRHFV